MKKLIYILSIIATIFMFSCTDVHDTYKEYQGDGERIYVGKLTEVNVQEGYNRLIVKGSTKYMSTAVECIIELVGHNKIFTVDIDKSAPEFLYEIKDIAEGNYYIRIISRDKEGNLSVPELYNADVYGDELISTYYPKKIIKMEYQPTDGSINLNWNQSDNIYDVLVTYFNADGESETITVASDAKITNLLSWKSNTVLTAISRAIPDTSSLDIISLAPLEYTLPEDPIIEIPRSTFKDARMPSDVINGYGGSVEKLWDNKTWNSSDGYHSADGQGIPHHLTIDMGLTSTVTDCEVFFTGFERTEWVPEIFQIWGIEDVDNLQDHEPSVASIDSGWENEAIAKGWKKLTPDDIVLTGWKPSLKVSCSQDYSNIRYIRYRIVRTLWAPHVGTGVYGFASEIKLWGKKVSIIE